MKTYSRSHLADHSLLSQLTARVTQTRTTTAELLADIAEVDERKLYRQAAYPSMYAYCVHELHMSEDTTFKRIRAARAARQFPAIFEAIADGRLNLSAVVLLAPHLKSGNADDLLAAATHKTKAEIELLLAHHFPQPDVETLVQAIPPAVAADDRAPGQLVLSAGPDIAVQMGPLAPGPVVPSIEPKNAPRVEPLSPRAKLTPLSPGRFALQTTVSGHTNELMLYTQALLGHAVPSGDLPELIERAFEALVEKLEKQKFAKCARSRPRSSKAKGRYIPAEIRRTVWQRDGGQCTFVSEKGNRCEARKPLEYDHVKEVARGGQTTAGSMRLRCRAHNQYTAECRFGAGFMQEKREDARSKAARAKEQKQAAANVTTENDVTPWLRALGFTAQEARRGAELCAQLPDTAPLEERVRVAARGLAPACIRTPAPAASSPA